MRILYSAIDQIGAGRSWGIGSCHGRRRRACRARARGARARVAGRWRFFRRGCALVRDAAAVRHPAAALLRARAVASRARSIQPDVVIERYYNFGGEGLLAARRLGALAVLEVNAPVVDYPGSLKRGSIGAARRADAAVAGLAVPAGRSDHHAQHAGSSRQHVPRRVLQTEWGADTERFRPGAPGGFRSRAMRDVVAVFSGAFRAWHGAIHLVDAIRRLHARGRHTQGGARRRWPGAGTRA